MRKKDIFKHGILAFESLKLKNELSALQDVQPDNLDIFLNVAGRLDSIEATYYYQIVKSRLAVIQRIILIKTANTKKRFLFCGTLQ